LINSKVQSHSQTGLLILRPLLILTHEILQFHITLKLFL